MRRSFFIILVLIGIALVAGILYFLLNRGTPPPRLSSPGTGGALPEVPPFGAGGLLPAGGSAGNGGGGATGGGTPGTKSFGVVSQNPVLSFYVAPDNSILFIQPDGQVFRVQAATPTALSTNKISALLSASFSADGRFLLVALGSQNMPEYSVFDVENKAWTPLPQTVRAAAWSPSGSVLVFLRDTGTSLVLTTLDEGNQKAKPQDVMSLHMEDAVLSWVQSSTIFISDRPSALSKGSLWALDIKAKKLRPFLEEKGLVVLWNASGTRGIVFAASDTGHGGSLRLVDSKGLTMQPFSFLTLPSKCAFGETKNTSAVSSTTQPISSTETFYCALPRGGDAFQKSVLPDDYYKRALFTADDIYAVKSDGSLTLILQFPVAVDADKAYIRNQKLFFVNRLDQKLYVVTLPAL